MASADEMGSPSTPVESNDPDEATPETSYRRRSSRVAAGVARPAHFTMFDHIPSAPTSYFKKKKKAADPQPLIWTKKEKKYFYAALVQYGHDDITLLQKSVPTRSKAEIKEKITHYQSMNLHYRCVQPKGSNPQRTCLRWMNVLDQACRDNDENSKLSTAVAATMECDEANPHKNVYKFVQKLLEDKLNPDDVTKLTPQEGELILRTMNEVQSVAKLCNETIINDPVFKILPEDLPPNSRSQENITPEKPTTQGNTTAGTGNDEASSTPEIANEEENMTSGTGNIEGNTAPQTDDTQASTTPGTQTKEQTTDQSTAAAGSKRAAAGPDKKKTKFKRINLMGQLKNAQFTSVNPLCFTENTMSEMNMIVHNKLEDIAETGQ